jgi:hypothetical protein
LDWRAANDDSDGDDYWRIRDGIVGGANMPGPGEMELQVASGEFVAGD